jgi:hypothetical protein
MSHHSAALSLLRPLLGLALLGAPLPALAQPLSPDQTAKTLGGLDVEAMKGDAARAKLLSAFAKTASETWGKYEATIAKPMTAWAATAVPQASGDTVFYPFSGPDLPTAVQLYPKASRYVLVAIQNAGPMPDLKGMPEKAFNKAMGVFKRGWVDFSRRGFFRTEDLKADTAKGGPLTGVTPVLLAFASRLGFTVTDAQPIRVRGDGSELETHPGDRAAFDTWKSIRLHVRRADGSTAVVDYVQTDLSDAGLEKHGNVRGWLATVARGRIMTKAASHLMQKSFFSKIKDIVVQNGRSIVQDETGLEYKDLLKGYQATLYGRFQKVHRLFPGEPQTALAAAYRDGKDIKPLPFKYGYEKDRGSCLVVGVRK